MSRETAAAILTRVYFENVPKGAFKRFFHAPTTLRPSLAAIDAIGHVYAALLDRMDNFDKLRRPVNKKPDDPPF